MRIKQYIKPFLFASLLAAPLTACEDYLEVTPPGEFASNNVLTNEAGLTSLLYSAYTNYNIQNIYKDVINMEEVTTDMAFNSGGGENRTLSLFINFTWDPSVAWLEVDMWNQAYFAIRDANLLIDNVDNSDADEAMKAQLKAEARYIRATEYAFLYGWFGSVPLVVSSTDAEPKGRASEEEIKDFIAMELSEIVADLPAPGQEAQYGRASKGHALGILTKFYLNTKQWQKVVEVSQQLMDLGYYELYPDFTKLFRVENEQNREMIVAWPQIADLQLGNMFPNGAVPPGFQYSEKLPELVWTTGMSNWATQYRLRDEFVDSFDPTDARFGLIIEDYINLQGKKVNLRNTPDNSRSLKFFDNNALGNFHGNDTPIVRYADILLSRAEALNEINGPTQEALDLINQVRNRAGLADLTMTEASSKEALRDLILQERGWEFVSEAKRREDLIRHGKFVSKAQARGVNAQGFHVRFPIPEKEMNSNPALEGQQNQGY
ncbi:RagB/SusD family nutrient uptake outer membrane protein [Limibacter armeniacum]|uniref:RagB/SusD family nutrient uptake outer membrane protein n=1 Tax=Limibacter armeniacum TaxID=466084 RepID=UPI002FE64FDB